VTEDVQHAREDLSREWVPLTPEEVGETPYLLIGTVDDMVATLQARRDRWGISYVVVFERDTAAFARSWPGSPAAYQPSAADDPLSLVPGSPVSD